MQRHCHCWDRFAWIAEWRVQGRRQTVPAVVTFIILQPLIYLYRYPSICMPLLIVLEQWMISFGRICSVKWGNPRPDEGKKKLRVLFIPLFGYKVQPNSILHLISSFTKSQVSMVLWISLLTKGFWLVIGKNFQVWGAWKVVLDHWNNEFADNWL